MTALELEEQLHRATVEHEAAHCAAAVLLHMDVKRVEVQRVKFADMKLGTVTGKIWAVHEDDELGRRARATMALVGHMCEEGDRGDTWPPSFDALMNPQRGETGDTTELRGLVKAMRLGARGYSALCLDALKLACSDEFVTLHREVCNALHTYDGHLDEKDIAAIREKARQPEPEPDPREGERDEDGCLTDEAIDLAINRMRRARVIASNGDDRPSIAETKMAGYEFAVKAFESGKVQFASFTC